MTRLCTTRLETRHLRILLTTHCVNGRLFAHFQRPNFFHVSLLQIQLLSNKQLDLKTFVIFLFNDALNTFYLRLYGVGHMVKDHSYSERGNLLLPHGLLFPISSKGYFICTIPQTGQHIPRPLLHQLWSTGWNEK